MKCVICHGDDIRLTRVFEEIERGNDIVRIPLEIPVCANCGERYYDRPTMQRLERMREEIRRRKTPLKPTGKVLTYG